MCKRVKCEVGKRNVLKSNMNIKIMDVSDVVFPQGKVKKELKYYYRHREEILAKKREKRDADPKYQEKQREKEERKRRAGEEKELRAAERARKRAAELGVSLPVGNKTDDLILTST